MFVIITGYHPFYLNGESKESYKKKLLNPKWEYPSEFSALAKLLFEKMVKCKPLERYTAEEALSHPWITRCPNSIPLSYMDTIAYDNSKKQITKVKNSFINNNLDFPYHFLHWAM